MKRTIRVCLALLLTGATFALAGGSLFAISGRVDGWGAGTVTIGAFGYEEEFLISRSILNPDGSFALSLPDLSGVTMRHPPAPPTCLVDDAVTLKAEPAGLLVYESASFDKIAVVKDNAFVGILDLSSHSMEAGAPQADLGYLFFASGLQKAFWQYWSDAGHVTGTCTVRTREKVLYWDYDLQVQAGWNVVYEDGINVARDHVLFTTTRPVGELAWRFTSIK